MVIPNLLNSENGRLRRDGNTVPNQTQNSSEQQVSDSSWRKRGFRLKKHKDESGAWQQRCQPPANSPRFQSFANENENLSKVCQTFRLLQQKVRQAFQTCQTCRFSEFGSQSNTNSESSKSTVFRIGTNQTHPNLSLAAHRFVSFRGPLSPWVHCGHIAISH